MSYVTPEEQAAALASVGHTPAPLAELVGPDGTPLATAAPVDQADPIIADLADIADPGLMGQLIGGVNALVSAAQDALDPLEPFVDYVLAHVPADLAERCGPMLAPVVRELLSKAGTDNVSSMVGDLMRAAELLCSGDIDGAATIAESYGAGESIRALVAHLRGAGADAQD